MQKISKDTHKDLSNQLVLLSGISNIPLAQAVARELCMPLQIPIKRFADGEIRVTIEENLRNRDVVILQSTNTSDAFIELFEMADAVKRAAGKKVTAITPYFGYARQDRKEKPRVPITAALMAKLMVTAGVDHLISIDLHSEQIQGAVNTPWDVLYAHTLLLPEIRKWKYADLLIISPDPGGVRRAEHYQQLLQAKGMAIIYKKRDTHKENQSQALGVMGNVKGMQCVIVDDMLDSCKTVFNAASLLLASGAKSVSLVCTHGIFSAGALERIQSDVFQRVVITDTLAPPTAFLTGTLHEKCKIVSVAPLIAAAIYANQTGGSLSKLIVSTEP